MKKKILIISFLVVMVILLKVVYPKFFTNLLLIVSHEGSLSGKPFLETCIQSDTLAYDRINGNSIKYIGCIKGYIYIPWEYSLISQVTDGYLISDKNEKVVSIIPIQKYNDREFFDEFEKNGYPSFSLKENGFFLLEKSAISNLEDAGGSRINFNELFSFHDNKIEKIRDVLVGSSDVLAFRNNEVIYIKNGQSIIKENILSGELTTLLEAGKLKTSSFYTRLYHVCISKNQSNLATFEIITAFDEQTHEQTSEYFYLNLDSKELTKIVRNGESIINSNCEPPNKEMILPPQVTYSYLEGIASKYNLTYMPNRKMDVYDFLLQRKGGVKHQLPR